MDQGGGRVDAQRLAARGGLSAFVALLVAALVVFGADVAFHVLPEILSEVFQKFVSCAVFFGAALACAVKARLTPAERAAWTLFALAMALWGTGATYFALVLWDAEEVPYPSPGDAFWLLFYVPAYAGVGVLLRARASEARRGVWMDALVAGLGVGGAAAAVAFDIVLDNTEGSVTATLTNLAYPVADIGLLALVVALITITGWRGAGAWRWIAASLVVFAVADSVYLIQVAIGSYAPGDLVDLGWPTAAILIAVAAWTPERAIDDIPERPQILVPAIAGFAALGLLVFDHFVRTNLLALTLVTASILLILVRLYLTVRENARMLEASRREAATDALTGLGNRRQLSADLTAQLDDLDPERPLMLTLFDLDGFKQYNDTFGHPAGDQLLERLGGRLCDALAGRGTAYRMGGDEFCAVWNLSGPDQASVAVMESVAALSEKGEGFEIGCSYGSVLLPNETRDPIEALRVADRRMYTRKRSSRASAGQQSSDVLLQALAERDADLGEHLGGVAELARSVAIRLGLPQEDLEGVRLTALLHDVGKVAIPDAILHKPAPLNDSEWEFIRRHTLVGERIIAAAPSLAHVAKYVRWSHERYDGAGYPDGLAGDEIPLPARIVAVCDAYDAMVTNRTYRAALNPAEAVEELRRCAGTQFDPAVVEAFADELGMVGVGVTSDSGADRTTARPGRQTGV